MKKFILAPHLLVLLAMRVLLPETQGAFEMGVTASPTTISLGGSVTYTIRLTNTFVAVQAVRVVNEFPANAAVIRAVNNFQAGGVVTNSGQITFTADVMNIGQIATFELQLAPSGRGSFTNRVTALTSSGVVPQVTTNVVVSVALPQADLAIGIEGYPANVLVGDAFDYLITTTNFGPGLASNVNLQSTLPVGLEFVSVTPEISSSFNATTRFLLLTPGSITNGTARDFLVTLQATAAGEFNNLLTSVATQDTSDPADTNNTVTNRVTVLPFVTNRLAIVSVTPQKLNRQNGLMEQLVVVSNRTTEAIASARVIVTNIVEPNALYNASGFNSGNPYVLVANRLGANATANVLLQFLVPSRAPIDVGFVAVEGPRLNFLPLPNGTPIAITRFAHLRTSFGSDTSEAYSSVYVEFATTAGRTYSLISVPTVEGTNWIAAQPPIVANSTHGRFVDTGPQVTGDGQRFYRVIEHQ